MKNSHSDQRSQRRIPEDPQPELNQPGWPAHRADADISGDHPIGVDSAVCCCLENIDTVPDFLPPDIADHRSSLPTDMQNADQEHAENSQKVYSQIPFLPLSSSPHDPVHLPLQPCFNFCITGYGTLCRGLRSPPPRHHRC